MIFRQATQEDLDFVRQNPFEEAVKNYANLTVPEKNCYTVIFQDVIVGVCGITVLWEGVGEVWLMLTADCRKKGFFGVIALAAIKTKMEEMTFGLKRVQAIIRTDFPEAIKMIEFLGFVNETPEGMESYFPDGGNAYLYAKIRRPNG